MFQDSGVTSTLCGGAWESLNAFNTLGSSTARHGCCPAGSFMSNPSGAFTTANSCSQCAIGFYQPNTGIYDCKPCETGKTSPSNALVCYDAANCPQGMYASGTETVCASCGTGKYSGQVAQISESTCLRCVIGKYNDQIGQISETDCTNCEVGQYNGQLAQPSCQDNCNAGSYINTEQTECLVCQIGRYQNENKQSECKKCIAGKHNEQTQQTSETDCKVCQAGKYANQQGTVTCTECPLGTFNSDLAVTAVKHDAVDTCLQCSPGLTSELGALFCFGCSPGKHNTSNSTEPCRDCPRGYMSQAVGKGPKAWLTCAKCGKGYYQEHSGQPFCLPCIPGKHQPEKGAFKCENCGIDKFTNITAQSACQECGVGTLANRGSSRCLPCPPGEAGTPCASCKVGEYRPAKTEQGEETDPTICLSCPKGSYQNEEGLAYCINCIPGQYQDVEGKTKCRECQEGKHEAEPGAGIIVKRDTPTVCTECKYKCFFVSFHL